MTLKERLTYTDEYFQVLPSEDGECRLYYKVLSLAEEVDWENGFSEGKYHSIYGTKNPIDERMKAKLFLVVEKKDGKIQEECVFRPMNHIRKSPAELVILLANDERRFGPDACRIRITWTKGTAERIHHDYIYLKNVATGDKYYFATECIEAFKEDRNKCSYDEYIFYHMDGQTIEDYEIEVIPWLKEKYRIVFDKAS